MVISCLLYGRARRILCQDAIYFDLQRHIAIAVAVSVQEGVTDPLNGQEGPRRRQCDFSPPEPGRTPSSSPKPLTSGEEIGAVTTECPNPAVMSRTSTFGPLSWKRFGMYRTDTDPVTHSRTCLAFAASSLDLRE
jgi:hypothetical protein